MSEHIVVDGIGYAFESDAGAITVTDDEDVVGIVQIDHDLEHAEVTYFDYHIEYDDDDVVSGRDSVSSRIDYFEVMNKTDQDVATWIVCTHPANN